MCHCVVRFPIRLLAYTAQIFFPYAVHALNHDKHVVSACSPCCRLAAVEAVILTRVVLLLDDDYS